MARSRTALPRPRRGRTTGSWRSAPKHLYDASKHSFESSHHVFQGAFPDGFPWEVLDVFSGPPKVAFTWRHWGTFTGSYEGQRGKGEVIELYGFTVATVDAGSSDPDAGSVLQTRGVPEGTEGHPGSRGAEGREGSRRIGMSDSHYA